MTGPKITIEHLAQLMEETMAETKSLANSTGFVVVYGNDLLPFRTSGTHIALSGGPIRVWKTLSNASGICDILKLKTNERIVVMPCIDWAPARLEIQQKVANSLRDMGERNGR